MDTALHRREFLAARALGVTGVLAGCVDSDAAMFVDPVPTDRRPAQQGTLQPDRYGPCRTRVANGATDCPAAAGGALRFNPSRVTAATDEVRGV